MAPRYGPHHTPEHERGHNHGNTLHCIRKDTGPQATPNNIQNSGEGYPAHDYPTPASPNIRHNIEDKKYGEEDIAQHIGPGLNINQDRQETGAGTKTEFEPLGVGEHPR
jgi:hypothetical protein